MKPFLIITALLLAPLFSQAQTIPQSWWQTKTIPQSYWQEVHKGALEIMGITFLNEPENPDVYIATWQAFDKFNKTTGQQFNLTIEFKDRGFACGVATNAAGCYHFDKKLIQVIGNPGSLKAYRHVLLHEYAHSLGELDETEAEKFADKYNN